MTEEILRELRELRIQLASHSLQDTTNFGAINKKLDSITTNVNGLKIKMSVVWSMGGGALALFGAWLLQLLPAKG